MSDETIYGGGRQAGKQNSHERRIWNTAIETAARLLQDYDAAPELIAKVRDLKLSRPPEEYTSKEASPVLTRIEAKGGKFVETEPGRTEFVPDSSQKT